MKRHALDNFTCPTDEISAYIDAEISPSREIELEMHFAECESCSEELNLQKQFLCGLDSSMKIEGDIELPADFARHIVANAESTVAGLRRPRERYNAIFICTAMMLFGLFALGSDAGRVVGGATFAFEQISSVGGFFARVVYSIFLGFAIIIRSLAAQVQIGDGSMLIVPVVLGAGFLMYLSRKVLRTNRV